MRRTFKWSRRLFVLAGAGTAITIAAGCNGRPRPAPAEKPTAKVPTPEEIPKFASPLLVPAAMPKAGKRTLPSGAEVDYYEIAVQQFEQQVLPEGFPKTTVWGYGPVGDDTRFSAPSATIEATVGVPVLVKWVNGLVDASGKYLQHLLPIDPTLHWANPGGGKNGTDMKSMDAMPYTGPVPIVTHVHGAHTYDDSDGLPRSWYLPAVTNMPEGFAYAGGEYEAARQSAMQRNGVGWDVGSAVFEYPNDQRASTLWYHDHAMGITRLNVYTGPAGFYILRGGPTDEVRTKAGEPAVLPGSEGDSATASRAYEVGIALQDRSFNPDGSLSYPDNRAFFEGLEKKDLKIPFFPEPACEGQSDLAPIWNPEFFGTTIIANGQTWPYFEVEPRRYRFRFLNGCQSRFLILRLEDDRSFWQIGSEGGFLPEPVELKELLVAPAERADVIVDFAGMKPGDKVRLLNVAPDEPFGGGEFEPANVDTTGQVMEFRAVEPAGTDPTTAPTDLVLPALELLGKADKTRKVSLNELDSRTVRVVKEDDGSIVLACEDDDAEPFGPREAALGTVDRAGKGVTREFRDDVTEIVKTGATEIWELHNFTMDAHPIHLHQVMFEVLDRKSSKTGKVRRPEKWETGFKDTVIAYPDEVTRIKARFDIAGTYVWHCHILEHEDNEMMRPYRVE